MLLVCFQVYFGVSVSIGTGLVTMGLSCAGRLFQCKTISPENCSGNGPLYKNLVPEVMHMYYWCATP